MIQSDVQYTCLGNAYSLFEDALVLGGGLEVFHGRKGISDLAVPIRNKEINHFLSIFGMSSMFVSR